MKIKIITLVLSLFLVASIVSSAVFLTNAAVPAWPSLPSTSVNLNAVYGDAHPNPYFMSTLSGVPSGYDIKNGVYSGWCVDTSVTMQQGVAHPVKLYSSLSNSLPSPLKSINWNAINYILNHKQSITIWSIQDAIWHYTNNLVVTSDSGATQMVSAANAHPGYMPGPGDIVAVIAYAGPSATNVQTSIIELSVPAGSGLSPGYWKHNVNVYNGGHGSFSGDPHITAKQLETYAAYIQVHFYSGFNLAWANSQFELHNAAQSLKIANWFNAAAGLSLYRDN